VILSLVAGAALAQDFFACSQVFTEAEIQGALDRAFAAVDAADARTLKEALNEAGPKFPCLGVPADRRLLARYGQLMAVATFFSQDEEAQVRWGLFAKLVDPDVPWPTAIGAEHPLRQLIAEQQIPPTAMPEGKGLKPPKAGAIALNGNWTVEASAYAEVPMLVQVFDSTATPTVSYWQDGGAFPDWILGEPDPEWAPPRWTADPVAARDRSKGKVAKYEKGPKTREPIEIDWGPVLVTSGLVAGSGALFGVAGVFHAGLPVAASPEELTRARSNTNALFSLGVVTGVAAVSYGSLQVFTDGKRIVFHGRF